MDEIQAVNSGKLREIRLIADLFIEDFSPGPLFMELKTPLPNLDICAESKRKILTFKTLYLDKNPQAYLGLYYNPFYPEEYKHSFTKRVMDMKREVLIGEEMWDTLGGKGTYQELLKLIEEVAKETR